MGGHRKKFLLQIKYYNGGWGVGSYKDNIISKEDLKAKEKVTRINQLAKKSKNTSLKGRQL